MKRMILTGILAIGTGASMPDGSGPACGTEGTGA
jgi:hypothetical protein